MGEDILTVHGSETDYKWVWHNLEQLVSSLSKRDTVPSLRSQDAQKCPKVAALTLPWLLLEEESYLKETKQNKQKTPNVSGKIEKETVPTREIICWRLYIQFHAPL